MIRTEDSTLLRQPLVVKELENQLLRHQITTQQQEIEQLEARIKQYENPNTPPSEQLGDFIRAHETTSAVLDKNEIPDQWSNLQATIHSRTWIRHRSQPKIEETALVNH